MKFLIYDYSTPWSTEAKYFHGGLNFLSQKNICSSFIYNNSLSLYDNFDSVNPNYIILKYNLINKDLLSYISENPKIHSVINVDDLEEEKILQLHEKLCNVNQNITVFGKKHITLKNFVQILPSADIFIPNDTPAFKIDKLIFIEKESDITDIDGTYHYTSNKEDLFKYVDFVLPIMELQKIFNNYSEIVFKGIDYIGSQISFNAIYSGTKVSFESDDPEYTDKMHSIFKGQKLIHAVKNRHTCIHRLKSLLNGLNLPEAASELNNLLEKI